MDRRVPGDEDGLAPDRAVTAVDPADRGSAHFLVKADGVIAGLATLEGVFRTALSVTGASRLLFGTDSSFFPRGWQKGVFETQYAVFRSLGQSADDEALVFGGNFERLFPPLPAPQPGTVEPRAGSR